MERRYISDEIGNEYLKWTYGDIVFITASTGAGKSHFILNVYLDWIIQKGGRLLYLVNRRILREQLQNEVNTEIARAISEKYGLDTNIQNYIEITTYQALENSLKSSYYEACKCLESMQKFTCVVCDECHYFYTDSNFNTGTELSLDLIRELFNNKLQIYISATADPIKQEMEKYFEKKQDTNQIISFGGKVPFRRKKKIFMEYGGNYNFGGLCPHIVIDQDSLIDKIRSNICDTKDKWMIFVDSIDAGKELQKALRCNPQIKDSDIVFIDADYEKAEEADKTVKEIVENKSSRKRVIISTAVMDNGITFQDSDLVNIAIFSDVKETFVQMLGRKRLNDNEIIHLYICQRSEKYFNKRYSYVHNILSTYYKRQSELDILSKPYCYRKNNQSETIMLSYIENFFRYGGIGVHRSLEKYFISQQKILDVLLSNSIETQYLKRFCYAVNGNINVNSLAVRRLLDLEAYYKEIAEKLADNENAFIEQQFEWLGIPADNVHEYTDEAMQEMSERYRNELKYSMDEIINKQDGIMTVKENIEWKMTMKKQLEYFLQKDKYDENELKSLGQKDRPLVGKRFESVMKKAGLPYMMKTDGKKDKLRYIISSGINK